MKINRRSWLFIISHTQTKDGIHALQLTVWVQQLGVHTYTLSMVRFIPLFYFFSKFKIFLEYLKLLNVLFYIFLQNCLRKMTTTRTIFRNPSEKHLHQILKVYKNSKYVFFWPIVILITCFSINFIRNTTDAIKIEPESDPFDRYATNSNIGNIQPVNRLVKSTTNTWWPIWKWFSTSKYDWTNFVSIFILYEFIVSNPRLALVSKNANQNIESDLNDQVDSKEQNYDMEIFQGNISTVDTTESDVVSALSTHLYLKNKYYLYKIVK